MKEGRSLLDLAAELKRQSDAKKDFVASAQSLHLTSNGHSHLSIDTLIGGNYAMNAVAHGQLAEYTGIPKAFYDRLRENTESLRLPLRDPAYDPYQQDHPLFDVLVNRLLKAKGDDGRLIRTLDGTCRAFLSDTYNPDLDHLDVYAVLARVLEEKGLGPEQVVSCEVTDRRLYIKVVSPKLEATIKPENLHRPHGGQYFLKEPQVVRCGFVLQNSETGLGSLAIKQVVYKLQCTNLWITEDAYRQRHVGKALESGEDGAIYKSDTRVADARARLLKIRDHVEDVLNEHRFHALVAKMQETAGQRLEGNVEKVVETTARRFGLTQDERESVLRNLIEGADLSCYGLSNAITATAATVESYDRASDLEVIGGRFFTMPANELKEIARAA